MKFAHFSQPWDRPDMTPAQRYDLMWREVELADQLGFDYGFHSVHHFHKLRPPTTVYCTAVAQRTKRIRVGPMGYIVPLVDPIRIIEEASVLDNLLGGRFELGLVGGTYPEYFRIHHLDWEQRREMTHEAVLLAKEAWAGKPFKFSGPFHQYEEAMLSIQPLQRPHPPIWVQSRHPDTLKFLAEKGVHTGYLFAFSRQQANPLYRAYLEQWQQAGHEGRPNISYEIFVYLDETDEAAIANGARHVLNGLDCLYGQGSSRGVHEPLRHFEPEEIMGNLEDIEYLMANNLVLIGSPETVVNHIKAAAQEGFFNTLLCEFNIGLISEEEIMRSMKLFGTQVIPALKDFDPTR